MHTRGPKVVSTASQWDGSESTVSGSTTELSCSNGAKGAALLPGPPTHGPGPSWRALGRTRWWCSPAEAPWCCRGSAGVPVGHAASHEEWLRDNMVDEDTTDWTLAWRILKQSQSGEWSQSRVDLIPPPLCDVRMYYISQNLNMQWNNEIPNILILT